MVQDQVVVVVGEVRHKEAADLVQVRRLLLVLVIILQLSSIDSNALNFSEISD